MLKAKGSKFEVQQNVQLRASSYFFLLAAYLFFLGWVWFWHPTRQQQPERLAVHSPVSLWPLQTSTGLLKGIYHSPRARHTWEALIRNFFGNILLFVPLGVLLGMRDEGGLRWIKMDEGGLRGFPSSFHPFILSSLHLLFLLSLGAEAVQYATQTGFFDVDDIVLNVLGGGMGMRVMSYECEV